MQTATESLKSIRMCARVCVYVYVFIYIYMYIYIHVFLFKQYLYEQKENLIFSDLKTTTTTTTTTTTSSSSITGINKNNT